LADRVLWLHDGEATMLEGGYDAYEALQRGEELAPEPPPSRTKKKEEAREAADVRKRAADAKRDLSAAEAAVAKLDRRKAEIELEFTDPAIYDDQPRVAALTAELRELEPKMAAALAHWEQLIEREEAPA
jgi:ATP-binding cassette subfamily F protein 3